MDLEINAENAYKALYDYPAEELRNLISEQKEVAVAPDTVLIDVRTPEEYRHEHLPGSLNIDHEEVLRNIVALSGTWKGEKVIAICRSGGRSMLVARVLRQHGIEVSSIQGGMIEWSRRNLPHWKPET